MKKHWLRGVLLGVSLALLLASGVALAQQAVSVEPYCGVCCDLYDVVDCVDLTPNYWTVTTTGWGASETLFFSLSFPGHPAFMGFGGMTDSTGYFEAYLVLFCENPESLSPLANYYGFGNHWSELGAYGEWDVRVTGEGTGEAVNHFYFAKDISECEVEEEFIPEPGSILLLGSGLAGLAGYATLRLRGRTRE